jgi:hypothetical protein
MTEDTWTRATDLDIVLNTKIRQVFENVGIFIKEYKGYYIFAGGINKDKESVLHYFSLTLIPRGQIIKIKQL